MDTRTEIDAENRGTASRGCRARLLLGCAALALVPSVSLAQDAPAEDEAFALETDGTFRLSPIIVNARIEADDDANSIVARELWVGGKVATSILDTPASVSVITQKEITERNAKTVEEVLEYTPGIITDYYGTDDRNDYYLVRGFQASTYRDGLTLGTMRGVREEPYAYQRVEVLKGANSTLFGASDPGGSVNFVTKMPTFDRFASAYVQAGSYDHYEAGFDVGDVLNANATLSYRLTGKLQDSKLEYDHSRDDEEFIMGGLAWAPSDATTLTFILDRLDRDGTPNSGGYPMDREYDRDRFFGIPDFNYQNVERTTATGLLNHDFGGGWSLQATLRYSDLKDDYGYAYLTDSPDRVGDIVTRDGIASDNTAKELIGNVIAQYDARLGVMDSSTLFGAEYRDAKTTARSLWGPASPIDIRDPIYGRAPTDLAVYADRDNDYTTKSLFLQQNLSFYERAIVTFGARQDWMDLSSKGESWAVPFDDSDDFSESSIRGAFTYKVTDEVSAYVSYVESVAPPQIGVEPERGEQYEIGVKYAPAGMNALITAAVFDLTKKDITVAVVGDDGVIDQQLIGEVRSRGFEIEGKAELIDNLNLVAGYSYLDTNIVKSALVRGVDVEGNQFASVPKNMASLWGYYTIPGAGARGDISIGLGARYTGSYYFNTQNTGGKSEAATLVDAALAYSVTPSAQLTLNISNLFDEQHVVGRGTADYYNPGRTIIAGLNYTW